MTKLAEPYGAGCLEIKQLRPRGLLAHMRGASPALFFPRPPVNFHRGQSAPLFRAGQLTLKGTPNQQRKVSQNEYQPVFKWSATHSCLGLSLPSSTPEPFSWLKRTRPPPTGIKSTVLNRDPYMIRQWWFPCILVENVSLKASAFNALSSSP